MPTFSFPSYRTITSLLITIAGCLFLMALSACQGPQSETSSQTEEKSALVQQLEAIFYAEDFADIPEQTFNTADYGAVGDDKTLNTQAIQQAIDAASEAGGGRVTFKDGIYLSGALFIKSNVELHLNEGVTIKAVQDDAHFPDKWTRVAGVEMDWPAALINIYDEKNVRITGKGTIDGNGKYWWDKFWGDPPRSGGMWVDYTERDIRWAVDYDCKRVRALVVYQSEDVLLKDFNVDRSGFWTISLTYSERVHVDGVTIRNNIGGFGPSSDGINTDSSSEILVENCDIDCNDDNLCIKAGRDSDGLRVNRPAENIVYRNCITRAGHGLFTIGSETSGGMRNVEVYGLEAIGTNTGIRFKSAKVRGGLIENIWFHDIKMKSVKSPFHFELNWYPEYSYPTIPEAEMKDGIPRHWEVMTTPVEPAERGIPEFRNMRLSNITVEDAEQGIYANAYEEKPMRNLQWENITIEADKAGVLNYAQDWTMKNVVLKTQTDQPLQLVGSQNIELPQWESMTASENGESTSIEEQLAQWQSAHPNVHLIPLNPTDRKLIAEKDTATFSKAMTVYVLDAEEEAIQYIEPLGDGFYFSPITITKKGNSLSVYGERDHDWTFHIKTSIPPTEVSGADDWNYNNEAKELTVEKAGMQFEIRF